MPASPTFDQQCVDLLSGLILCPASACTPKAEKGLAIALRFTPDQRKKLLEIGNSHHVLIRGLSALEQHASLSGKSELAGWARAAVLAERSRIDHAMAFLENILGELAAAGCAVTTIKTLDHYPDFGSDVDLYTSADEAAVRRVFVNRLKARVEPRSWGDRLAHKWNFAIPGLPELVEVHSQRLGQTGEQTILARRFLTRRMFKEVDGYSLPTPAPEERIIIATLQRMYRHFYFRLSDILNTAALAEANAIDSHELRAASNLGGIWPGVATYLKIASDYVERYRGRPLALPSEVLQAAQFGAERLEVRNCFLRVPIVPDGASLFV